MNGKCSAGRLKPRRGLSAGLFPEAKADIFKGRSVFPAPAFRKSSRAEAPGGGVFVPAMRMPRLRREVGESLDAAGTRGVSPWPDVRGLLQLPDEDSENDAGAVGAFNETPTMKPKE